MMAADLVKAFDELHPLEREKAAEGILPLIDKPLDYFDFNAIEQMLWDKLLEGRSTAAGIVSFAEAVIEAYEKDTAGTE